MMAPFKRVVLRLIVVAPFAVSSLLALLVYPRGAAASFYGWPDMSMSAGALGLLLAACAFCAMAAAYRRAPRLLPAFIAAGILARLLVALALLPGLRPYSDYEQVWEIATGTASQGTILYKSFFSEWCNYTALVKTLVCLFDVSWG